MKLKIGISSCLFHPDPARATFAPKTLLYYEESMPRWVMRHGAMPILMPRSTEYFPMKDLVSEIDGLLLHGGADLAPESYGEKPIENGKWPGDAIRDEYEIELYRECVKQNKPVLGICRGHQVINVAEGGTLYQDIKTQVPGSLLHRDPVIYDGLFHQVKISKDSLVREIYNLSEDTVTTNSVHHQAVKDVAPNFIAGALSPEDGVNESIQHKDTGLNTPETPFILGVQWHPEFMVGLDDKYLDPKPLIEQFLTEVKIRKK